MSRRTKYHRGVVAATIALAAAMSIILGSGPLLPASPLSAAVGAVRVVLSSSITNAPSNYIITFSTSATLSTADSITVRFWYGTTVPATCAWNPGDVTVESATKSEAVNPETSINIDDLTSTDPMVTPAA